MTGPVEGLQQPRVYHRRWAAHQRVSRQPEAEGTASSIRIRIRASPNAISSPERRRTPRDPVGTAIVRPPRTMRSEEHTSELQSQSNLVCRLLLEKKKKTKQKHKIYKHN